ncbi:MAG: MBL fold metallo-hydrolase [Micromonosporaceae bacterium]|nr:MBL fold metallo-hydrolase [Micromonosporaceae bacterium]
MTGFVEVARDVYVLRYPRFDVNVTLVVGDGEALLVDTLCTPAQAAELASAARRLTSNPWTIVNTHAHFDHCLGNATLADPERPIWAHEETAVQMREHADRLRRAWYAECLTLDPQLAPEMAETPILAPTRTVHVRAVLDVGGRMVVLHHLGRGHTAGDLVVQVPDADVVVAGDLIEESGPPAFGDAYPLEWPGTLAGLLRLISPRSVVVPGHGAPVSHDFVAGQHADLVRLEWLIREGEANGSPAEAVAARAPFDRDTALTAVRRGYQQIR